MENVLVMNCQKPEYRDSISAGMIADKFTAFDMTVRDLARSFP